jgi:hypothetical protein
MRDMGFLHRGCELNGFEAFSNGTSNATANNRLVHIIGCSLIIYSILCVSAMPMHIYLVTCIGTVTFPLRICILYLVHSDDDLSGYLLRIF